MVAPSALLTKAEAKADVTPPPHNQKKKIILMELASSMLYAVFDDEISPLLNLRPKSPSKNLFQTRKPPHFLAYSHLHRR